jgi:uncharacterized protein YndB with AHSA1/START domain
MSEVRIEDTLTVGAPVVDVWNALKDPVVHARWHPFVTEIAGEHRLGQVRTCLVVVRGTHGETKERCVVEEPASRIGWSVEEDATGFGRMVSNWCAGFSLTSRDGKTLVTAESTFEPNNLLMRAMLPMIRRKFHQTQRAILAALKDSLGTHGDVAEPRSKDGSAFDTSSRT